MRAMRKMLDRRILACLMLCALCSACNDTDDIHVGLRTSEYLCSDGLVAQNSVALICGSTVDIDVMEIVLVIGGATTADNIKGLHFDVVYPRSFFSYVDGSASMIADNFLTWGDGSCDVGGTNLCTAGDIGSICATNAACNVPGVNMPVLSASETLDPPPDPMNPNVVPGRLTITIDRANPADGVGASLGGQNPVMRFLMRAESFETGGVDPTLLNFENAAAVDPADTPIGTVPFNDQLLLWVQ